MAFSRSHSVPLGPKLPHHIEPPDRTEPAEMCVWPSLHELLAEAPRAATRDGARLVLAAPIVVAGHHEVGSWSLHLHARHHRIRSGLVAMKAPAYTAAHKSLGEASKGKG